MMGAKWVARNSALVWCIFDEDLPLGDSRIAEFLGPKAEENAVKAAAAPALLEALQLLCSTPDGSTMVGTYDRGPHFMAACEAWDKARAAIQKATP